MRSILASKPFIVLSFMGLTASTPARADLATILSALVLGSAVVNGLDLGDSDLSKSQPSSQLAQSFRDLSKSERRAVQRRLKELGFYDRTVDGLWGTGTLTALRRYANSRGLSLSVNSSTEARRVLRSLRSTAPSRSVSASPASGFTPASDTNTADLLELGSELSRYQIKNLQLWLSANGYDAGPADGVFGDQSRRAAETYLSVRGLDLDRVDLPELYAMLEGSLESLIPSVPSNAAFDHYEDLDANDLGLELARRAVLAKSDLFENEAALWHWIELEFPREKYAAGGPLANSLTTGFYNGDAEEKSEAAALLQRLIQANVTDEPLQFVFRDKVTLQPVNFVPGRGIPIHDAALGANNFLPYTVGLRVVPIEPAMAQAKFYNNTVLDLGYLPVDGSRSGVIEQLLLDNPNYSFEMLSYVSLESLSKSILVTDLPSVFEAHASFDGFALVMTPDAAGSTRTETIVYVWQDSNPRPAPKSSSGRRTATEPSISVVKSTL